MTDSNSLYETRITSMRWIAYDLPANIGWVAYIVGLILCFIRKPAFMQNNIMAGYVLMSVIPAALMLMGILELINERICKLDRILPRKRLMRGFGAFTLGGILGTLLSAFGISYSVFTKNGMGMMYLIVMLAGAALCAAFGWLLYKGYRRI